MSTQKFILTIGISAIISTHSWSESLAQEAKFDFSSILTSVDNSDKSYRSSLDRIISTTDNKFISFGTFGNTAQTKEAQLLNTTVASPAAIYYDGATYNSAFIAIKHDGSGNVDWQISSAEGYVSSYTAMPTSDGGCVVAMKVSYESLNTYKSNVVLDIIDASGSSTKITVDWDENTFTDGKYHRIHYPALVKIDADGNVTATKVFSTSHAVAAKATDSYAFGTTDGLTINSACIDNNDNVYIAGLQREAIIVDGVTIEAHNVDEWDGDTQKSCGSAYIIKFDSNFNYLAHLCSQSEATKDQIDVITYKNDKLYIAGQVYGRKSFGIADKTDSDVDATPGSKAELWFASVNATDLTGNYIDVYTSTLTSDEYSTNIFRPKTMVISNDGEYAYLGGSFQRTGLTTQNGTIVMPGDKSKFCGFVAKISTTDGVLNNLYAHSTGISEFSTLLFDSNDSLWAYGYDWTKMSNDYVIGAYIFDRDLNIQNTLPLIKQNAMATSKAMAHIGNDFVFLAVLGSQTSAQVSFYNSDTTITPSGEYNAVIFGYSVDGNTSSLSTPCKTVGEDNIYVYAHNGVAHIKGAADKLVRIYDMRCSMVDSRYLTTDDETISLKRGIYIVNIDNRTQKISIE
ncbi:MAG: DUF6383 domain-containing protein [Marinilabiliaceae bacterium]|nr:DUF6383 domain-containing protein [Marinilabiliaceae bacterium]